MVASMNDFYIETADQFADVSVVIPCYRCTGTIERAFNSVVNQTLAPKEVILVEDFSDDSGVTLDFLYRIKMAYEGSIDVIVLPLSANLGPGGARNAGWEKASQPYIALLDSDDAWNYEKLSVQFFYMKKNSHVAITGHNCIVKEFSDESDRLEVVGTAKFEKIRSIRFLFKNCFPTSSVMLRRNIPFRFTPDKRAAEDTFLWQQVSFSGLIIVRINLPLVYYFKPLYGHGGLSSQLWTMEKAELSNFILLFKSRSISVLLLISAMIFSIVKFIKRIALTFFRNVVVYLNKYWHR
jgi:glycosyltransferase involved in cell wall biosynthesis